MEELLPLKRVFLACLLTAACFDHAAGFNDIITPLLTLANTRVNLINNTRTFQRTLQEGKAIEKVQAYLSVIQASGIQGSCQLWNRFPHWVSQNLNDSLRQAIKNTLISFGAATSCPEFILMSEYKFPTEEERAPLKTIKVPIVWVLGAPGSGKGTMCSMYKDDKSFTHISSGELLRAEVENPPTPIVGQLIKDAQEKGDLVPDVVVLGLIIRKMLSVMNSTQGFLIDGFPRTVYQAKLFKHVIKQPDTIMLLLARDDILKERVLARQQGRTDDTEATFNKRLEFYKSQTEPIAENAQFGYKINKVRVDDSTIEENYAKFSEYLTSTLVGKNLQDVVENLD